MRVLSGEHGPPLCVLGDFDYPVIRARLAPGEVLCLTTDGVTEAMDPQQNLYGSARLDACLTRCAGAASAAAVARAVKEDVARWTAGAEASDDLTLLAIRWSGTGP